MVDNYQIVLIRSWKIFQPCKMKTETMINKNINVNIGSFVFDGKLRKISPAKRKSELR